MSSMSNLACAIRTSLGVDWKILSIIVQNPCRCLQLLNKESSDVGATTRAVHIEDRDFVRAGGCPAIPVAQARCSGFDSW